MIILLIGILAGSTPAGNAIIDFGNITGTRAGFVWLLASVSTAIIAMELYVLEDRYETKHKRMRF